MNNNHEAVIGLEVHAELSTKSKIFCRCQNSFGDKPNTNVCPVCLGLPGALPVLNEQALKYAVKMGLALGCEIADISQLARKNYFYPDLPKAYQISQEKLPVCKNGLVKFYVDGKIKEVRIERIHIEEDAGKLIHTDEGTLIDYNRCGVPLIEIVTYPDINTSREAKAFLDTIKSILSYLDICDCRMQEGSIRCDVNVSVHKENEPLGTRVEMKNVNTFSGAVRAIDYEISRQLNCIKNGIAINQETRRWNDIKGESTILRDKENSQDYRFFPEPDIPPFKISEELVQELRKQIPDLPNYKKIRYITELQLAERDSEFISTSTELSGFFESCCTLKSCSEADICKWIMSDVVKHLNKHSVSISQTCLTPENLCRIIELVNLGELSNAEAKKALDVAFTKELSVDIIVDELGLKQISDHTALNEIAKKVLSENEKPLADYLNGKGNALGFLVGLCMKESKGKANPSLMKEILLKQIHKNNT